MGQRGAAPGTGRVLRGDCLDVLQAKVAPASVDLCYLDPPFFTGRDFGSFDDRWAWGEAAERDLGSARAACPEAGDRLEGLIAAAGDPALAAFLCFLAARLAAIRRVLAPHGSLFLHCDPTAGPYLRVLGDALLGRSAFVNEIVWRYRRWPVRTAAFQRMHDTLLYWVLRPEDPARRFSTLFEPRAPSTQRRWGEARIRASHRPDGSRAPSEEDAQASPGAPLSDVWDLPIIAPSARERTGYPTQKPLALLLRIVQSATAPGDLVLDPCCGSGTTLVAAARLDRRYLGIDTSEEAVGLARRRLAEEATGTLPLPIR